MNRITRIIGACAASWLGTFAHGAPVVATSGGLTIEQLQRTGSFFSANTGAGKVGYVEFRVQHRGKIVQVAGADAKPLTEFRDAWVLDGAPRASVLTGDGRSWYLITDDDQQVTVTSVTGGDEGQVQWVDMPTGPGENFGSAQVRRDARDERTLQGGRRLLLNRSQLLEVATLRLHTLDMSVPAGYRWSGQAPLWLSPDGRRLVWLYPGASNSTRDALLLVTHLGQARPELLQADLKALGAQDWTAVQPQWLSQHFEWRAAADGSQHLQRKPVRSTLPWRTRHDYGMAAPQGPQGAMPRYLLWPVRPGMLAMARTAVIDELKAEPAPVRAGDPPSAQFTRLSMSVYPVVLRYDAAQQALVVEAPELPPLLAQSAVNYIGELLDGKLASGSLRGQLMPPGDSAR